MNRAARKLREFIAAKYPKWLDTASVREEGDIEVSVAAPVGSQAEHLVLFTDKGTLWIRFNPPYMCYSVESVHEMSDIVGAILRDEVCFMVAMKGSTWLETTLVRNGQAPTAEADVAYKVVSWTGKNDKVIGGTPL